MTSDTAAAKLSDAGLSVISCRLSLREGQLRAYFQDGAQQGTDTEEFSGI